MEQQIDRRRRLPGGRAVVGGLLMAVAALGVFVAYSHASARPTEPVVVASTQLLVGETITAEDVHLVEADLPAEVATSTFGTAEDVIGRIALGPVGEGEIVQAGLVTNDVSGGARHEVAVTLPRAQMAVGRLKQGERVDLFVTYNDATELVVRSAEVVQIGSSADGSITSDREVELVVAVPSGDAVTALVDALRTGDVTVVRSTFGADGPSASEPAGP
ncbi:MAG: hypothetical protein EXQ71_10275 [Acidimicrobiia bacterium]|nr:hypothetical protein [Acidimicrobiia bacterium]